MVVLKSCGQQRRMKKLIKPVVFVGCLGPLGYLAWAAVNNALGANPIQEITFETGVWTLRFLTLTLLITPLRRLTGWNVLIKYRRMLGLYAFFYGCLHFTTYIWLDQFFDWHGMIKDIAKRPFITVGFTAFVLMIPLALTSTTASIRWLGGRRWNLLHRLIYVSAMLGVVHYLWLVKADTSRPIRYGVIIGTLLLARVIHTMRQRRAPAPSRAPGARASARAAGASVAE
jgi:sulfoxide reductase heme-binding subunit YedZ